MHVPQFLFDRFQQPANLLTQFGIVSVAVCGYRVIDRGVEHFFFRALEPQRAAAFAWMIGNRFLFCLT